MRTRIGIIDLFEKQAFPEYPGRLVGMIQSICPSAQIFRIGALTQALTNDLDCLILTPGANFSGLSDHLGDELVDITKVAIARLPILGIGMGMLWLSHFLGCRIIRAPHLYHGKEGTVKHDGEGVFQGLRSPMRAKLFASLTIDTRDLPNGFYITATAEQDQMPYGFRSRELALEGTRIHPQAQTYLEGYATLSNFLAKSRAGSLVSEISFTSPPEEYRRAVSVFREANRRILHAVEGDPSLLQRLDWERFEELVAELLIRGGYEVRLTMRTRDGGYDILAMEHGTDPRVKMLVECKRLSPPSKVGVKVVRELLGVGSIESATGLVIVTSTGFTRPARALAEANPWRLRLVDYEDLMAWVRGTGPGKNVATTKSSIGSL